MVWKPADDNNWLTEMHGCTLRAMRRIDGGAWWAIVVDPDGHTSGAGPFAMRIWAQARAEQIASRIIVDGGSTL